MKKFLSLLLTLCLSVSFISAVPMTASAEGEAKVGENVTAVWDANGNVTISGTGPMYDYNSGSSASPFRNNEEIVSVVIEEGVTHIGAYTFKSKSLESVTMADSVTSMGKYAFQQCTNLSSVTLSERLETIGAVAFQLCGNLTSIEIPNTVTFIGATAFGNTGLTEIVIPDSVTTLDKNVFSYCANLTSAILPDGITSISMYMFQGCTALEEITFSNSVTLVDSYAFNKCSSLSTVNFKGTEEEWSAITFELLNDSLEDATVNFIEGYPTEAPTEAPTEIPTEAPTEAPTPTPVPTVVIEAPSVSIASSMVSYGTVVHISPAYGAHFSYRVNGGEWISEFLTTSITIYEDTTLEVESWCDVLDPNVNYEYGSATYTYAVDPSTFPTPIPTEDPGVTPSPGAGFNPSGSKPLSTGTANSIGVAEGAEELYYQFVPTVDGVYRFYTQGDNDPKAVLYDSQGYILATNDNVSEDDYNFSISEELSRGEVYYINISLSLHSNQDSFYFYVEREDGATEAPTEQPTEAPTEEPDAVSGVISGGTLSVTPNALPVGCRVSYAAYLGNQMVGFGTFIYEDLGKDFILPDEYDYIKIFAWDGMTPVINPKEVE